MSNGEYKFAKDDDRYFIKLTGDLKYNESGNFASFINHLDRNREFKNILVDMTEVDYIDSTNLGLLAKLAQMVIEKYNHRITVLTTNPDITDLLHNIGFDDICLLIEDPETLDMPFENIMGVDEAEESMAKVMLEAHRRLMNMNEENKKEFKNVVELLEKQVE
ncbi:MAG: STAS domain-containing protein [Fidelibacterota bacterium]